MTSVSERPAGGALPFLKDAETNDGIEGRRCPPPFSAARSMLGWAPAA